MSDNNNTNKDSFDIKNGYLLKNGKKVFCVGLSYYASYHERKVPVPPEDDRIGQMKLDIKGMADAGFNLVRFASLGDVHYDEDRNVVVNTPLIDAMLREASDDGIAVMLRLQGYTMNLSNHKNILMVDGNGKEMDTSVWYNFIQNTFFHDGIIEDNDAATEALAKHFKEIGGVAAFQTYNEPHYPSGGFFDYHPCAIAAYRKWLADTGRKTPEDAAICEPPRNRPTGSESAEEWVNWRLFSMEALSNFLNHCSDVAKNATGIETMTCLTTDPSLVDNVGRGVNFYDSARGMDALGITQYFQITKPQAYLANMNLDMAESAASTYGKPLWIVEYDARTSIPQEIFRRKSYMALGCGCKAIMYYQWRGDHIYPDSPEGNGFGLINYDRTPTANYDNALKTVAVINKLSDIFVNSNKKRTGVAILHSDYAFMKADAMENPKIIPANKYLDEVGRVYTELRLEGISPDFVRACDLEDNPLGVKVLYLPTTVLLNNTERQQINRFKESGGIVFRRNEGSLVCSGYIPFDYKHREYKADYDVLDTLRLANIEPSVKLSGSRDFICQTLENDDYYTIVLTNVCNIENEPYDITLSLRSDMVAVSAELYEFEKPDTHTDLTIDNGIIKLHALTDGGIVVLKKH